MAAIVLLAAATAPAEAQRRNRNHWTTDADIGRGDGPVDDQALRNAPANPAEWLHFGGNYASWRHSPIERLTPGSVGDLKLAWMAQTGVPGQLETSPIVYDGILYLTSARNRLQALDAKTGYTALAIRPSPPRRPPSLLRTGQPRRRDRRRCGADGHARREAGRAASQDR